MGKLIVFLVCLAIMVSLPVVLIVAALNQDVSITLAQNMAIVKAAFVAWIFAVFIGSSLEM